MEWKCPKIEWYKDVYNTLAFQKLIACGNLPTNRRLKDDILRPVPPNSRALRRRKEKRPIHWEKKFQIEVVQIGKYIWIWVIL